MSATIASVFTYIDLVVIVFLLSWFRCLGSIGPNGFDVYSEFPREVIVLYSSRTIRTFAPAAAVCTSLLHLSRNELKTAVDRGHAVSLDDTNFRLVPVRRGDVVNHIEGRGDARQ